MQVGQGLHHDLLIGVETRVDGAHGNPRGQHGSARTGRHQVAHGNFDAAHTARHWGAHLGVREVQLRGLQRGLGGAQVGIGLALGIQALVVLALGNGFFFEQARSALQFAGGVRQAGLRSDHLGFGAVHLRSVGGWVHRDQQVALLDQRAFAEVHGLHGARDAGAHIHALHGFEPAGELVPQGDVFLQHGSHRHRHGGRGCGGAIRLRHGRLKHQNSSRHGGRHGRGKGGQTQGAALGELGE